MANLKAGAVTFVVLLLLYFYAFSQANLFSPYTSGAAAVFGFVVILILSVIVAAKA